MTLKAMGASGGVGGGSGGSGGAKLTVERESCTEVLGPYSVTAARLTRSQCNRVIQVVGDISSTGGQLMLAEYALRVAVGPRGVLFAQSGELVEAGEVHPVLGLILSREAYDVLAELDAGEKKGVFGKIAGFALSLISDEGAEKKDGTSPSSSAA